MKKTVFISLFILSVFTYFSLAEDSIAVIDTIQVENTVSDSVLEEGKNPLTKIEEAEENAENNAQWFMYGFLVLGAFLVFWKLKNNK
jgi:hypothetical protein